MEGTGNWYSALYVCPYMAFTSPGPKVINECLLSELLEEEEIFL